MSLRVTELVARDVRFPTSDFLDGSDAMNPDPDYSAAYVELHTSDAEFVGHGLTFTIGRGNDLCTAAIEALRPHVVGRELDELEGDLGGFWRTLAGDSQLRWLGPEKGVVHLGLAAVVNAVWDLLARRARKPLWKYLVDLPSRTLVAAIDFRHLRDALEPDEALELLERAQRGAEKREAELARDGYPAYTTSAGWLGYPDDKIRALCREAIGAGWSALKLKVGRDRADDVRRLAIVREEIGPERRLMVDANQVWDVPQAIEWVRELAPYGPFWIEEPTSPDDVLGHARIRAAVQPIGVATGEHCANRVMWKQFFQAQAVDFAQIDGCRLGGVNEVLAVLLLAAKFGVPVCPHAGGVGLCEYAQHWSILDYVRVSASLERRLLEHAAHLHEHFTAPIAVRGGRYLLPSQPGANVELRRESVEEYRYPDGRVWRERERRRRR